MLHLLYVLLATARSSLKAQRELALENLALRQQLAIVQRKTKRPRLTQADRAFWVALCSLWPDWHNALIIVKPQTVIGWHRKGFKLYWTWKSRKRTGRPPIDAEIRTLIRRMASENPTWGRSSLSRWSAGCIIATRDAQPHPKSRSHTKSGVSVSCAHCARLTRMPQSDSRLSNLRQRTQGSELCPLRHLRDHRGSRLATDSVLRNDSDFYVLM
jgi:hypothetical protein